MRNLVLILMLLLAYSCIDNKIQDTALDTLHIDLGKDTSFCCNESLKLCLNEEYEAYQWGTSGPFIQISDSSCIEIVYPGTYWVTVTDSLGRQASDTIVVTKEYYQSASDTCNDMWEIEFFYDYSISLPCDYIASSCQREDSYVFQAWSSDNLIKLFGERYAWINYDTLYVTPEAYETDYEFSKVISDLNGEEIGICLMHKNPDPELVMDVNSVFLFNLEGRYIELFQLGFRSNQKDEIYNLLKTVKKNSL